MVKLSSLERKKKASGQDQRKESSAVQGPMDVYKTKGAGDVLPVPACRSNVSGGTPSAGVHGTYAAGISLSFSAF